MKKIVLGILAHVDSGKTTLSEGLLYSAGEIRKRGRVDHGDTFLDTNHIERERGITIFSKQAILNCEDTVITLLDTPGHVDFSSETERTLAVLDYAIMVISGTDGVQSHTETLWHLLKNHNIPVFVFVNKMDISPYNEDSLLHNLKAKLSENCVSFKEQISDSFFESIAMSDDMAMAEFFETGKVSKERIKELILKRKVFPCFFGSALKQEGVDEFLKLFLENITKKEPNDKFGARVFKITEDESNNRLTHIKVTGGVLNVKDLVSYTDKTNTLLEEKVNSIRVYSGNKFNSVNKAEEGTVCALLGLSRTYPGQGLGFEETKDETLLEPVFSYKVQINDGTDTLVLLSRLRKLEEEEPSLNVFYNEQLKEIHLRLMGEVQCEVLKRVILERFKTDIDFACGGIVYKETVFEPAYGVGHFEPLRHYAEVHLVISPGERGSGIVFSTDVSEDFLSKNWQRLIMTHLEEKKHLGVLTGSELTDVKITLVSGKAHIKHTEGGDFRQATYRAVRQGLMNAKSVLLEPWYSFCLYVPQENTGRAMTDIEKMGGTLSLPDTEGEFSVLKGEAPVVSISEYPKEVIAYTKGRGHITLKLAGYREAKNAEEIIKSIGYDPEADLLNTPDSVFCTHGAGFLVKWNEVYDFMHLPMKTDEKEDEEELKTAFRPKERIHATDEELIKIFENTYGKITARPTYEVKTHKETPSAKPKTKIKKYDKTYLLVDGYNVIFSSDELKEYAKESLDMARSSLISKLSDYQSVRESEVIVVFDAYKVKGKHREVEKIDNISVVYTKEAETADAYIEKATHTLSKNNRVYVATSDGLEQIIILGGGALRISARSLLEDIKKAKEEIQKLIEDFNKKANS